MHWGYEHWTATFCVPWNTQQISQYRFELNIEALNVTGGMITKPLKVLQKSLDIQEKINAKTKDLHDVINKENELKVLRIRLNMELNALQGQIH